MSDRRRRARLQDIANIAEALREPVEAPDLTSSILQRVHAERPFVDRRTRQWVPVVRVGAAAMAALTVFAVTLIIFVKPSLPEQLGAAPSVTTELVNSAEQSVTAGMAGLRKGVQSLSAATDPRRLIPLEGSEASSAPVVSRPEPVRVEPPSEPMHFVVTTVTLPLPAPVPVALPRVAPGSWHGYAGEAPAGRSFAPVSFERVGVSSSDVHRALYPGGYAAYGEQRAARTGVVSQYKSSLASFGVPMTSPKPGSLNPGSPALVKDLVNYITGQQAGEEPVIR